MSEALSAEELVVLEHVVEERGKFRTHWEGCYLEHNHRDCAIQGVTGD